MKHVFENEAEWLAYRKDHLTASEVADVMGHGYTGAYGLWATKTGKLPGFSGNIATQVGHAVEQVIADAYSDMANVPLIDPGDYTVYEWAEWPVLSATPDRLIGDPDVPHKVVELKHVSERNVRDVRDGIAHDGHVCQLYTQMMCTGAREGVIVYLVGNSDVFPIEYTYDVDMANSIDAICREFWYDYVEPDVPPEPDFQALPVLQKLHPRDTGDTVECEAVTSWAERYKELQAQKKVLDQSIDECKAKMMAAMEDATWMLAGPYKISWKYQTRKEHVVKESSCRKFDVRKL